MSSYPTDRPAINTDEIRAALEAFHPSGAVFEVRALDVEFNGYAPATYSGIFTDPRIAAESVAAFAGTSGAYYVTIQTINPLIAAKRTDRLRKSRGGDATSERKSRGGSATSDNDVVKYRWLPIDVDPVREVSGIMASDEECRHAESIADEMQFNLAARGWPEPIVSDSGNGRHLLYRVDLAASDAPLVKAALEALDNGYSRPEAKVDTAVFNPARIWRLPGTINRKGADAPDMGRPWRKAAILSRPTDPGIVTREQLEQLVRDMGKPPEPAHGKASRVGPTSSSFDVREWIARHITPQGIETNERQEAGLTVFHLSRCPMCDDHDESYKPSISEDADGRLGFKCFGNRCQGIGWRELRERFEPMATRTTSPASVAPTGPNEATKPEETPAFCKLMTSAELLDADLSITYLVDDILVEGQPCVLGGLSKSLKTSVAIDLAVSLSAGKPFLSKFRAQQRRVGIWSGESGPATLINLAQRVALPKFVDLRHDGPLWSFALPKLSRVDHLHMFERVIRDEGIQVAFVDPLYLCLLGADDASNASNVYAMGAKLSPLSEIGQRTGCTLIVLHHFKRSAGRDAEKAEPAALESLSQSGVVEWARQWLLLQRRSPYQSDGRHELWLRAGGSAGHAGLYSVDVEEGSRTDGAEGEDGRHWIVSVGNVGDAVEHAKAEREDRAERQRQERVAKQEAADVATIVKVMRQYPNGETRSRLRNAAGLSGERFAKALTTMLGTGHVESIEITKNNRQEEAFRYVEHPGRLAQDVA